MEISKLIISCNRLIKRDRVLMAMHERSDKITSLGDGGGRSARIANSPEKIFPPRCSVRTPKKRRRLVEIIRVFGVSFFHHECR